MLYYPSLRGSIELTLTMPHLHVASGREVGRLVRRHAMVGDVALLLLRLLDRDPGEAVQRGPILRLVRLAHANAAELVDPLSQALLGLGLGLGFELGKG